MVSHWSRGYTVGLEDSLHNYVSYIQITVHSFMYDVVQTFYECTMCIARVSGDWLCSGNSTAWLGLEKTSRFGLKL